MGQGNTVYLAASMFLTTLACESKVVVLKGKTKDSQGASISHIVSYLVVSHGGATGFYLQKTCESISANGLISKFLFSQRQSSAIELS